MTFTRLILVRHGETVWNVEGKYQGQADSPLTPLGIEQSRALAARAERVEFTALASSDLGRAVQTARIIADRTGHSVQLDSRLRERSLGIFQGLTRAVVQQKFPDEYDSFKRAGPDYVVPKGESVLQSTDRMVACLNELAARHAGRQVLVVTHGGVLGAFLRHVLGIPPGASRRFKRFNASWNVFTCEDGRWFLETWGDTSHLDHALSLDDV